jgi:hypothetical protein
MIMMCMHRQQLTLKPCLLPHSSLGVRELHTKPCKESDQVRCWALLCLFVALLPLR